MTARDKDILVLELGGLDDVHPIILLVVVLDSWMTQSVAQRAWSGGRKRRVGKEDVHVT